MKRLELAAYHEAGHAVVTYLLGGDLSGVSIMVDTTSVGRCLSAVRMVDVEEWQAPEGDQWREREAMIALAGPIAAKIHNPKVHLPSTRNNGDWKNALMLALLSGSDRGVAVFWLDSLQERTKGLLTEQQIWDAVEAVANALMTKRSLPGERAQQIMAQVAERH